jgi:hypothetical protein
METTEVVVGLVSDLDDPGCREFTIGEGDWPFRGFIVRQGDERCLSEFLHARRSSAQLETRRLPDRGWQPDYLLITRRYL